MGLCYWLLSAAPSQAALPISVGARIEDYAQDKRNTFHTLRRGEVVRRPTVQGQLLAAHALLEPPAERIRELLGYIERLAIAEDCAWMHRGRPASEEVQAPGRGLSLAWRS